jgi:S-adenosylmethionine synthetase
MTLAVINTPEAKKRINQKLQEISNSFTRIEAEKDLVKTIVGDIAEEFQIEKKFVNKMARTFHKDSFATEAKEKTEFEIIYETVTGQSAEAGDSYNGEDGE